MRGAGADVADARTGDRLTWDFGFGTVADHRCLPVARSSAATVAVSTKAANRPGACSTMNYQRSGRYCRDVG